MSSSRRSVVELDESIQAIRRRVSELLQEHAAVTISDCILLEMSKEGWQAAKEYFPQERGVYIHFAEYLGTIVVFRLGLSVQKSGIQGRWFHNHASHVHSFRHQWDQNLWHGGENYCHFFSQITQYFPETWMLFVITPEMNIRTVQLLEQYLIDQLQPLWEYQDNDQYVWKNGFSMVAPPSLHSLIENSLQ